MVDGKPIEKRREDVPAHLLQQAGLVEGAVTLDGDPFIPIGIANHLARPGI